MSTFDLTKPVKNNLRGDDTAKFRVANDTEADALITGDLIKLGHIIYHEADGKHYQLKTYPTFGNLAGVVWEDLGGSTPINNTLTSTSTTEALSANQGRVVNEKADSALQQVGQLWDEKAAQGQVDAIQSELTGLAALLDADDVDLDTAQERIDFIKNLESELDGLQISDIENLQTTLDSKQAKTTTAIATGGIDLNNTYNNKIVTLDLATDFVTINETNITDAVFQVQITTKAIGAEVRFTGDSANLEYNSLTDNKIVFTDRNMSVFVFKNDSGKFCWRVSYGNSENFTTELKNKLTELVNFPPPFLQELIPESTLPLTTSNFTIKGANFTEDMTIICEGQTVNYFTFISSIEVAVNITSGSEEGLFDITLDNGTSVTFQESLLIVTGNSQTPTSDNWTSDSGVADVSENGAIKMVVQNGSASSTLDYVIPSGQDFRIQWRHVRSPYQQSVTGDDKNYIVLKENGADRYRVSYWYGSQVRFFQASTGLGHPNAIHSSPFNVDTPETLYLQRIGNAVTFNKAGVTLKLADDTSNTGDIVVRFGIGVFDFDNIRYIQLT